MRLRKISLPRLMIRKKRKTDEMSGGKGHSPVRTCISCGKKAKKFRLIRLILTEDGEVVMDIKKDMPGRGGYVHDSGACRERLPKSRSLKRAFKGKDIRSFSPGLITV
ncbi:YlxR family protein [Thermodesulfobacteriota bacterium]